MAFECGVIASCRVKLVCYKCRVSSSSSSGPAAPQKKIQELGRSIRYREFVFPRSSFRVKACKQLSDNGMDEDHCSSDPLTSSTEKSDLMEQVRDHQPSSWEGDAYLAGLSEKEIERRRKIGAANKGKAPWSKGRKLSKGITMLFPTSVI